MNTKYPYSMRTLANGLRVLHVPFEKSGFVLLSLLGKVGRRAELDNEIGAAHFLEHLFFDGTKKRPSAFEISKFIEYHGGFYNGSTGAETVEYWVKLLSEKTEVAFDFLSDMFFNSLLNEVEKEKTVIAQEARGKRDDPWVSLERRQRSAIYPGGQPIGRTIFDEEHNLPNVTKEMLCNYMKRTYVAQNFILTIGGNIKKEEAFSLAEKYFSTFQGGVEVVFSKPHFETNQVVTITNGDFKQSKLLITFKGFSYFTREQLAASYLADILGSGSSSRFCNRIRHDLAIAYSIGSSSSGSSDTGEFEIYASADEEKLQQLFDEVSNEIRKLFKDGITEEEMTKVRNGALSGIASSFEKLGSYTDYFSPWILFGHKVPTVEERIEEIKSITSDEVMVVARQIFADKPKINVLTKSLTKLDVNFDFGL